MSQTTGYDFTMARGQAGQLADSRDNTVLSFAAEGAIAFGIPVMRGTAGNQVVISDASSFVGVSLFEHNHENEYQTTNGAEYLDGEAVSVLSQGSVLVASSVDSVAAGEVAYVTSAGAFTNVSTDNLEVGEFESAGDTGDLVVLTINRP